jgi:peptidoglycan/xylan/chitin deacetylase (PgdA/CDA1 family)
MNAMWSAAKMRVSHRLAMHVPVECFRLNNATPMVSFTFDDIPKSAATTGAGILEDHGARGTFYVSGGLVGTTESPDWAAVDAEDIVTLHRSGHEIGCHTYSHRRTCDFDRVSLAGEIEQNRRYLQSLEPSIELANFAYPFGYGSFAHKRRLKTAFQSCRSIVPGVNSGTVDPQFLRAVPLIDRHIDGDGIERAFDQAQTTNGWLIFYSHDVVEQPSRYGCSPALMNHALKAASRRQIPVLNMAEALLCAAA